MDIKIKTQVEDKEIELWLEKLNSGRYSINFNPSTLTLNEYKSASGIIDCLHKLICCAEIINGDT